jgi:hypothetical protein
MISRMRPGARTARQVLSCEQEARTAREVLSYEQERCSCLSSLCLESSAARADAAFAALIDRDSLEDIGRDFRGKAPTIFDAFAHLKRTTVRPAAQGARAFVQARGAHFGSVLEMILKRNTVPHANFDLEKTRPGRCSRANKFHDRYLVGCALRTTPAFQTVREGCGSFPPTAPLKDDLFSGSLTLEYRVNASATTPARTRLRRGPPTARPCPTARPR